MALDSKQIQQALLGAGITLVFYFSGFFVFWTPLPLLYLSLVKDVRTWRLSFLLIGFAAFLFYGWLLPSLVEAGQITRIRFFGLCYLFFYLAVALSLSLAAWKRWSLVALGWRGGLGVTAGLLLLGFLVQGLGLFDLLALLRAAIEEAQKVFDQMLTNPKLIQNRETLIPFLLQMKEWLGFLPKLLPVLLFAFSLLVMGLNIWVLKFYRKTAPHLVWLGPLQKLQIPHSGIWGLIISGALFFLNEYFFRLEWLKGAALNVALASLFVYFLQGWSVLTFFARRFSPLFRFGIYGLVLLFLQIFGVALVGVGVADTWFDFRKLNKSA